MGGRHLRPCRPTPSGSAQAGMRTPAAPSSPSSDSRSAAQIRPSIRWATSSRIEAVMCWYRPAMAPCDQPIRPSTTRSGTPRMKLVGPWRRCAGRHAAGHPVRRPSAGAASTRGSRCSDSVADRWGWRIPSRRPATAAPPCHAPGPARAGAAGAGSPIPRVARCPGGHSGISSRPCRPASYVRSRSGRHR